jgi:transcriptional regulator GlxA family with amidase domain
MTRVIGIFLFNDVEVLDFAGPFEVFSTASRVYQRLHLEAGKPFHVITLADEAGLISARANLKVQPDFTIADHPALDILIVPGGVVDATRRRTSVIQWISDIAKDTELTASVCTGAFLLAEAGLLAGRQVTTHWEDIPDLRKDFPNLTVLEDHPWVDTGNVVTSAGISAGIEMSLHLVARLESHDLAMRTARQMEYTWHSADPNT